MKRFYYIVLAIGLTACSATSTIPLDDAYIWPDKETAKVPSTAEPASSVETAAPAPAAPTLEYTNVQDTTITVKIKR